MQAIHTFYYINICLLLYTIQQLSIKNNTYIISYLEMFAEKNHVSIYLVFELDWKFITEEFRDHALKSLNQHTHKRHNTHDVRFKNSEKGYTMLCFIFFLCININPGRIDPTDILSSSFLVLNFYFHAGQRFSGCNVCALCSRIEMAILLIYYSF